MCVPACDGGDRGLLQNPILKGDAYLECFHTIILEPLLYFLPGHFLVTIVTFLILITTESQVVHIWQSFEFVTSCNNLPLVVIKIVH